MKNITDVEVLPLVYSVAEAAKILKIGRNTVYDMVRCGQLRSLRTRHRIRIPRSAILDYLNQAN